MNKPLPVNPPELRSTFVAASSMPWQRTEFDGIEMKILYQDDEGRSTILFKMAPGAVVPLHEHTALEQTFMLEGSLEDSEGSVGVGDFVWRPARSCHCTSTRRSNRPSCSKDRWKTRKAALAWVTSCGDRAATSMSRMLPTERCSSPYSIARTAFSMEPNFSLPPKNLCSSQDGLRGYPAYDKASAARDVSWRGSRHHQDIADSYVDVLRRHDGDRGG